MKRIKRQQNDIIQDNNNNKKQKLHNELSIINRNKTDFEYLPNEILYEIFDYLDIYHIYQGFFNLNQRFQNLFLNSNLSIQINIPIISKSNFDRYHKDMIISNKHRIKFFRLSNPLNFDIIFSPPRIIIQFIQLEILILDNIHIKYLNNILKHLIQLPKLCSLVLTLIDYIQDPSILFLCIFRLPVLKYCTLTYRTKKDQRLLSIDLTECKDSPIEHLVINTRFRVNLLVDLFFCLPQLRYLLIDSLDGYYYGSHRDECSIVLQHLKYVSLKFDCIHFNPLEILINKFFRHVEVLRISAIYDQTYLNAKKWEELIISFMPSLRVFDINHRGSALKYHDLIDQFNSSFWIERKWFFTHQHHAEETLDYGMFYSTNPYRRKDYTFWEFDQQSCSRIQENNLNSVKHVFIRGGQSTKNCVNYFPNATELTIENYFQTSDDSIITTLNRIIPLKQLTKLVIQTYGFSVKQIVKLIRFIPNIHTLKVNSLSLYETYLQSVEQSEDFLYVSNTNKIINLEISQWCTVEDIQIIVNLFPKLEYLKTGMYSQRIVQIMRYLLSKSNQKTSHLCFLCITNIYKICLKELNLLIKSENLLENYLMKFINDDLYLWW
ncbi:unnamed protein product [Rotaria sordida]|uniref:F-box domain-containing protein n=1 Tax=Rotaria sordida TaxID=392033 RepID=A0A819PDX5_9BILA|nr:unnamed protein product [Rotaria sordida]CAF4012413.1 unnamed protein product [Rotaria sordida]